MGRAALALALAVAVVAAVCGGAAACTVSNCATCQSNTTVLCETCDASFYQFNGTCNACSACTGDLVVDVACSATADTVCRLGAFATGNVELKIIGQSGKFDLVPVDAAGKAMNSKKVRVEMDSVRELDVSGNRVGQSGSAPGKHSLNTFASTDFTISNATITSYQGLSCQRVRFSVKLVNDVATLIMDTYLFNESGTVTVGNGTTSDSFAVSPGSLKFNIEANDWPFCSGTAGTPCSGATGAFLEVSIKVTGPATSGNAKQDNDGKSMYDLGEGAEFTLTNIMEVGGAFQNGTVTFTSNTLVVKFPRPDAALANTLLYDPVITASGDTNAAFPAAALSGLLAALTLAVATLLSVAL